MLLCLVHLLVRRLLRVFAGEGYPDRSTRMRVDVANAFAEGEKDGAGCGCALPLPKTSRYVKRSSTSARTTVSCSARRRSSSLKPLLEKITSRACAAFGPSIDLAA